MKRWPNMVLTILLLLGLPLAGVWMAGHNLAPYLEFPPRTRYVQHAPFSWLVFIGMAVVIITVLLPFVLGVILSNRLTRAMRVSKGDVAEVQDLGFPWWGWTALGAGLVFWVLAWTRFSWFKPLQLYTFSPLWFCYIVVVNALSYRRCGRCLMTHDTKYFLQLFVLSAVFWWFFEYLNRFVQNWYYVGCEHFSPLQYFIMATLPFSTVLPSVLSTEEWLAGYPRCCSGLNCFRPVRWGESKRGARGMTVLSAVGLFLIGLYPNQLYPLLWVAPLLLLVGLQRLSKGPAFFPELAKGDWRRIFRLALAALICGFFWEMWNSLSLAKWIYTVPYVQRFKLFEMPILGFAGYLPFGLECAVIARFLKSTESVDLTIHWKKPIILLGLFLLGIVWIPAAWNGRWAERWFNSEEQLQSELANGVAEWMESGLSREDFTTGSEQFDGEWLYGTYSMAAMGFGQCALTYPEQRERYLDLMEQAIHEMLSTRVRQFDVERWGNDPLDSLETSDGHAAYLGYMNLAMGFHVLLDPDSPFAVLNDRISNALRRRVEKSPTLLIESYPHETYPVDNCAVIASIALNDRVHGEPRSGLVDAWIARCRERYVDPSSGLLYQSLDGYSGRPYGAPRGSGTTLGLYFLSYMDMPLTQDLYVAVKKQLSRTICGFGFMREYPAGLRGQGDIDSGLVIFGLGLSPTGFALGGARICDDAKTFRALYATAHAAGAPFRSDDALHYVTGASLGDAILFAMLTAPKNGIEGIVK